MFSTTKTTEQIDQELSQSREAAEISYQSKLMTDLWKTRKDLEEAREELKVGKITDMLLMTAIGLFLGLIVVAYFLAFR